MEFEFFKSIISEISSKNLGGIDAQFKLAPKIRQPYSEELIKLKNPKKAAVLALFYPDKFNNTYVLLTKRASYDGTHSAQISFPGGKYDKQDITLKDTAIRETNEEIGIAVNDIVIFKEMTNVFIPPSNFLVTPYLAYLNEEPSFVKNHEVETLIEVSLTNFLSETCISSTIITTSYAKEMHVPCFKLNDYIVWGATAMMLSEIRDLFKKI